MTSKRELKRRIEDLEMLVKALNNQVKEDVVSRGMYWQLFNDSPRYEATIKGKVDQIAKHLGIDFVVTPERTLAPSVSVVPKQSVKKVSKK